MKYCSRCGATVSDAARFCNNCGYTFNNQSAVYMPPPAFVPIVQTVPAGLVRRTRESLRALAASPLYIVWMLLLAAQAMLLAVSFFGCYSNIGIFGSLASLFAFIIILIPQVLSAIGSLAVLCGVAGKSYKYPSSGGITALKVSTVFKMVCAILIFSIGFIAFISEIPGREYVNVFGTQINVFVLLILYLTAFVLVVVYYAMMSSSLGKMKIALSSGRPNEGASLFVQVMNYLLFLGCIVLFFRDVQDFEYMVSFRKTFSVFLLVSAIRYFFTSVVMMKYNREMRKLV